ncbi:MAG TPA: DUF2231 domain-containing protein [Coleofasciculaceae cyanobacterium]|jgi:uncharacterized membrane protein
MNELLKRPHPAIVHFPISLFPISLVFLILYWARDNVFFLNASFWCFVFGAVMLIPVAVTGFLDMIRLKSHSLEAHKSLNLHMLNGILITLLALSGGLYFFLNSPMRDPSLLPAYSLLMGVLSLLVAFQGYIGAVMVYRQHLGVDGDTR